METKRRILIPIEETRKETEHEAMNVDVVEQQPTVEVDDRLTQLLEDEKNKIDTTNGVFQASSSTNDAKATEEPQQKNESDVKEPPQQIMHPLTKGTMFYKAPKKNPPMSGQQTIVKWNTPSSYDKFRVVGDPYSYVEMAGWHCHGAKVWMGTSSTQVNEPVGVNPASGVSGFIPKAVQEFKSLVSLAKPMSENKSLFDEDGRPYQFAIVAVIGGQDHKKLVRMLENPEMNKQFLHAFREIGLPHVSMRAALYNEMGQLFGIEVKLGQSELWGQGRHMIFLHPANDIGGGKSDESLSDGRLSSQTSSLEKEFRWWIKALSLGGGSIGSIETTLGGTARIGRYAFERARVPRGMISKDAYEVLNVDTATWVKYNLDSQISEYRASFATTLLRSVYGVYAKRLNGVPLYIANRSDETLRTNHRRKSTIAILRTLFLGNDDVELLNWDISDERWAENRQEALTASDYLDIYDPIESASIYSPWLQQRRVRLTTSATLPLGKVNSIARGDDPDQAKDEAEKIIHELQSVSTSYEDKLEPGPFLILDFIVPETLLIDDLLTSDIVNLAAENFSKGFAQIGYDHRVVNVYKMPKAICRNERSISVLIHEEQPGVNVLAASTDEIDTHKKRVIMKNPNIKGIENDDAVKVYAFGRLLGRMVTAHSQSGYGPCEIDADLIHAFHRYYYGKYGHQPNLLLGGKGRTRTRRAD